jgi:hypothetical protein
VTRCGRFVSYAAITLERLTCSFPNAISPIGFHRLIQRVGETAKMPFPIHPHMLRHACGFKLANDGHDTRALQHYLGPQEHPAHGPVHRNGAGPLQEFLEGLTLGAAASGRRQARDDFRFPSITFALCAWASNDALRCSIMASSCSSVRSLSGLLCSTFISRGTASRRLSNTRPAIRAEPA